ncbi:pimeloyl-ACP methyl ester carboxylesterase [Mycolicibacterium moriokaense]|uniref:Pimeloyl-ACP methyl ester carboxylesterase n=1 Tax=Mycolicibacterium moriokaense TaxID=39691 RepID=A0A318HJ38_9MYCO|nr:pimeloyl-ACP methyl ester carboxylesterase [Mycolicibacterium moriokaense]
MAYRATTRSSPPETVVHKGIGRGEPVLLLHPFTLSQHVWADVVDRLSDSHEVLAVTLPGHWGATPLSPCTIGGYADAIECAMDAAGWDTAHLVGNSLGGWVAFDLEGRGRARSVLAIAPAGGWRHISVESLRVAGLFLWTFPFLVLGNLIGDRVIRARGVQRKALHGLVDDVDATDPEAALNALRAMTHCGGFLKTLWMGLRRGGVQHLAAVRVPVMLALCERDTFLPGSRYSAVYRDQLPAHTEHVTLPGVGHVAALENPQLVAETIATFVGRHRTSATRDLTSRP